MNGILFCFVYDIKLLYRRICKIYSGLMSREKDTIYIFMKNCAPLFAAFEEL